MARKLDLNDTLSMKGVAIIFIILHNLIHLICPIKKMNSTLMSSIPIHLSLIYYQPTTTCGLMSFHFWAGMEFPFSYSLADMD